MSGDASRKLGKHRFNDINQKERERNSSHRKLHAVRLHDFCLRCSSVSIDQLIAIPTVLQRLHGLCSGSELAEYRVRERKAELFADETVFGVGSLPFFRRLTSTSARAAGIPSRRRCAVLCANLKFGNARETRTVRAVCMRLGARGRWCASDGQRGD